jgi:purine-binding chemotaxis protein CheW
MTQPAPETRSFLVVRAGGRPVGLPLEELLEVLEPTRCLPVPAREPALRGVIDVRGRLVPVVHLGALLRGGACPPEVGEAVVIVRAGARRFGLEVDAADAVASEPTLPVPREAALPWAAALVRTAGGLVPLLDLGAVGARLTESGAGT